MRRLDTALGMTLGGPIGRAPRSSTPTGPRAAATGWKNLRFHWARYILHSLNRGVKTGEADWRDGGSTDFHVYRDEFYRVADGRAGA